LKEVQLYHLTTPSIQLQLLKTLHSIFRPPPALNIDQSIMLTCQATGYEHGCQQKEAWETVHALQQNLMSSNSSTNRPSNYAMGSARRKRKNRSN
jgi:hypothetical protein